MDGWAVVEVCTLLTLLVCEALKKSKVSNNRVFPEWESVPLYNPQTDVFSGMFLLHRAEAKTKKKKNKTKTRSVNRNQRRKLLLNNLSIQQTIDSDLISTSSARQSETLAALTPVTSHQRFTFHFL